MSGKATESLTGSRILVVDDEAPARSALTELLREEGYVAKGAADGFKALGALSEWKPDLIITDVKMPGLDGVELMRRAREIDEIPVVIMTAFGSVESAVGAMQQGADDYLTKPVNFNELLVVIQRVLQHSRLRRENVRLREALSSSPAETGGVEWIGQSQRSRELAILVRQVANSEANVLVTGEAGTGKEFTARALHRWSGRTGKFVRVHCAGLSSPVLEAELFGYMPGALPGFASRRIGACARAHEGTLFLDDVGQLPADVQTKFLGFLQDGEFEALGGDRSERANVRVVAASPTDLRKAVEEGRFHEELFYRLSVIGLEVPSLRQRREDIAELASFFLESHARAANKDIRGFSDRSLRVLMSYDWPGNIRQLQGCLERAVALCEGSEIAPKHLPSELMERMKAIDEVPPIPGTSMSELEKYAILKTLESVAGSTSKAAEILGISPRKIQYRLAEYRETDPSGLPSVVRGGGRVDPRS